MVLSRKVGAGDCARFSMLPSHGLKHYVKVVDEKVDGDRNPEVGPFRDPSFDHGDKGVSHEGVSYQEGISKEGKGLEMKDTQKGPFKS